MRQGERTVPENSGKPETWDGFFAALRGVEAISDFLSPEDRDQKSHDRDVFDWA